MNLNLKLHWENSPAPLGIKNKSKIEVLMPLGAMIIDPTYVTGDVTKAYVDLGDAAVRDYADSRDNSIIQAVGEALSQKAEQSTTENMFSELSQEIQGKADSAYVDSSVLPKADKSYVDSQDALITANFDASLSTKVSQTELADQVNLINSVVDTKADESDLQSLSASVSDKANKTYVDSQDTLINDRIDQKADASSVVQSLALKADLVGGKVPASQLPSSFDDVLDGLYISPTVFHDPNGVAYTPESGKIYIDTNTNVTYRWNGSAYLELGGGSGGSGLVLGETSSTAHRGDHGKAAYDHSVSTGNPHNSTTSDIPEGTRFYFTEGRVRLTPLVGLVLQNSTVVATDSVVNAIGKLQGQVNTKTSLSLGEGSTDAYRGDRGKVAYDHTFATGNVHGVTTGQISESGNLWFTPTRAVNSALTGITFADVSQVNQLDTVISAVGKLQAQVNTKTNLTLGNTSTTALAGNSTTTAISEGTNLYFTPARAVAAPLTGLSVATGGVVTDTDTVLGAVGKLQNQITNSGGGGSSAPVWVSITTIGTVAAYVGVHNIQLARWAGMLMLRGTYTPTTNIANLSELFRITDVNYKPLSYNASGYARLLQLIPHYNTSNSSKSMGLITTANISNLATALLADVIFEAKAIINTTDGTMNIPPTFIGTLAVP